MIITSKKKNGELIMSDYEALLKRARKQLPKKVLETSRFETPRVTGMIQGNKTIITNLFKISGRVNRNINDIIKFLSKELATAAEVSGQQVIFKGKFSSSVINEKLMKYLNTYVLCSECGKPDTKLIKEGRFTFIKCEACGAKKPLR